MYQFSRPHELIRSCSLDANRGLTCSQFHARSPAHAVTRPTSRTSGEASPYVGCSATAATHNRRSRPSLTQTDRLHEIDRDRGSPTAPKASVRVDLFGHAQPVNCASPAAQAKRVSTRAKREYAACHAMASVGAMQLSHRVPPASQLAGDGGFLGRRDGAAGRLWPCGGRSGPHTLAWRPFQALTQLRSVAIGYSLVRLCVAINSLHSVRTALRPLRRNRVAYGLAPGRLSTGADTSSRGA